MKNSRRPSPSFGNNRIYGVKPVNQMAARVSNYGKKESKLELLEKKLKKIKDPDKKKILIKEINEIISRNNKAFKKRCWNLLQLKKQNVNWKLPSGNETTNH